MSTLSRRTKRLLRTVQNESHANESDHEPSIVEQKEEKEEDFERDPESSEEEQQLPLSDATTSMNNILSPQCTKSTKSTKSSKRKIEVNKYEEREENEAGSIIFEDLSRHNSKKLRGPRYGGGNLHSSFRNIHSEQPRLSKSEKSSHKPHSNRSQSSFNFNSPPSSDISPTSKTSVTSEFKAPPAPKNSLAALSPISVFEKPPDLPDLSFKPNPLNSTRSRRMTRSTAIVTTLTPDSTPHTSENIMPSVSPEPLSNRCPICNKEVDQVLCDSWRAKYVRLNIQQQIDFCREHNRLSGRKNWEEKYPKHATVINVDWAGFDKRLQSHKSEMLWLIERPEKSFYRKEFEDSIVNTGTSRTMYKHVMKQNGSSNANQASISAGYYGTKGLKKMMAFITNEFSEALRERIGIDKVIAARDVTGYIHYVLTPELVTRLIMDDLSISKEKARIVMGESAALGDLLNPSNEDGSKK